MLKVTIELTAHPDLLGAIERLTEVFGGRAEKAIMPTPQVARAVMPAPQADPKPTPPKRAPKATPTPAPAEEMAEKQVPSEETKPRKPAPAPAHGITVEELRAKAQEVGMLGKREDIRSLLIDLGAENISSLDPAKYDEFLARLKAL